MKISLRENSIRVNVRNYKGVFYELLGIIGNEKRILKYIR